MDPYLRSTHPVQSPEAGLPPTTLPLCMLFLFYIFLCLTPILHVSALPVKLQKDVLVGSELATTGSAPVTPVSKPQAAPPVFLLPFVPPFNGPFQKQKKGIFERLRNIKGILWRQRRLDLEVDTYVILVISMLSLFTNTRS